MLADHRYLWSASFVRQRLQAGGLSEAATFRYFLVIMAFDWLQFTIIAAAPGRTVNVWSTVSAWTTLAITLGGLLYLYMRNGGGSGRNFLLRYFPLSVTVGWKFVVVLMAAMWLIPHVMAGATAQQRGWTATFVVAAINILMFGRIGAHLAFLSKRPFALPDAASDLPAA